MMQRRRRREPKPIAACNGSQSTLDSRDLAGATGGLDLNELHAAGKRRADEAWSKSSNVLSEPDLDAGTRATFRYGRHLMYGLEYLDGVRDKRLEQLGRRWWGDGL